MFFGGETQTFHYFPPLLSVPVRFMSNLSLLDTKHNKWVQVSSVTTMFLLDFTTLFLN